MSIDPFAGDVPEIPLDRAPLVRALMQVRYPRPAAFAGAATVERAIKSLAHEYPIVREQRGVALLLTPGGVTTQEGENQEWTLEDIEGTWRITLADRFASIESSKYESRTRFCARIGRVLEEVQAAINPPVFDRLGIRYTNRLEGAEVQEHIAEWVQPAGLGGVGIKSQHATVVHSLTDTLFTLDGAQVQARWGWLPANAIFDPSLPPATEPHWLFDIDVFTHQNATERFDAAKLTTLSREYADRAHSFFRWMMTDRFIAEFGSGSIEPS